MRVTQCVNCRYNPRLVPVLAIAELTGRNHHHHLMTCGDCGGRWFEDMVLSRSGVPVPSRRDSTLCPCPELDGVDRYAQSVVIVPSPEIYCTCSIAGIDREVVRIETGGQR